MDRIVPTLISCLNGEEFCDKLKTGLKEEYSRDIRKVPVKHIIFPNSEYKPEIEESIRGSEVCVVQLMDYSGKEVDYGKNKPKKLPLVTDVNTSHFFTLIDAVQRSSPHKTTAVIPNLPYSRQDKEERREPITSVRFAKEVELSGINRLITFDLHAEQISGFYDTTEVKVERLYGSSVFIPYLKARFGEEELRNSSFISPDIGGGDRARYYAKKFGGMLAICDKRKNTDVIDKSKIEKVHLIVEEGSIDELKKRKAFVLDDIIDTFGTNISVINKLNEVGVKEIYLIASFFLGNDGGDELLDGAYKDGKFNNLITLDTVWRTNEFLERYKNWLIQASCIPFLSKVISCVIENRSVSELIS